MQRLRQISSHFYPPSGVAALQEKHPDDVVVTMAIRSPLTKAKKGALKDTPHVPSPPSHAWTQCATPHSTDELMLEMFKASPPLAGHAC
jgi:acetyl-CoA acyltransferase 1